MIFRIQERERERERDVFVVPENNYYGGFRREEKKEGKKNTFAEHE